MKKKKKKANVKGKAKTSRKRSGVKDLAAARMRSDLPTEQVTLSYGKI